MRAVHILRDDHLTRPGGDLVHLHAHVQALRLHGIEAQATTWDAAPQSTDVVHLYNLDLPITDDENAVLFGARLLARGDLCSKTFGPRGAFTELFGDDLAFVVEHVAQHDERAFTCEQPRLRFTLPARGAGDQRDLAIDSSHAMILPQVRRHCSAAV